MKKLILILVLLLSCPLTFAAGNVTLDKIENSLYGYTYANENEVTRLNRIENSVYGKSSSGQTSTRIAKLKKDLSADLMGQEIEPKEDTFMEEEDSWVFAKEPTESSKIDYPVINELEKQVFNKEFKDQNIKTRLSNLEKKSFGKSYDTDDLATRVDRLKAEMKPKNFMDNQIAKQENDFYNGDIGKLNDNYHLDPYGTPFDYDAYNRQHNFKDYSDFDNLEEGPSVFKPSKNMNISSIEKSLFKTKYEGEPMDSRLSRVESSLFGTVFSGDNETERLTRISSALNAQKTARKYDSNRFGQNMATAFQIGTLILMVLACIL